MIFYGTAQAPPPALTAQVVEHAQSVGLYQGVSGEGPPLMVDIALTEADSVSAEAKRVEKPQQYDWNERKIMQKYIRLEQRVLAGKALPEERKQYRSMKEDRNSKIFADRYIRDYAEIQRLKILSQKLAEIQKFLCPIPIR